MHVRRVATRFAAALLALAPLGCEPSFPLVIERACANDAPCGPGTHCADALCVPDDPPVPLALPLLSGEPVDGRLLSSGEGRWDGTPPYRFAYRWERCDPSAVYCESIDGATEPSYRVQSLDLGRRLRATVEASNAAGSATSVSELSVPIAAGSPLLLVPPALSGVPHWGEQLSLSPGAWAGTPPIHLTVRWQRCSVGACLDIPGAAGSSLVLGDAEVGSAVRAVVGASNREGAGSGSTPELGPVVATPPAWLALPEISGTAEVGQSLAASPGIWTGIPAPRLTYQWRACDAAGTTCADLPGGTDSRYVVGYEAAERTVRLVVSAASLAGTASAASAPAGPVPLPPPANLSLPAVEGLAVVGNFLSSDDGRWAVASSRSRQWLRCGPGGGGCADLAGETTENYRPTSADEGSTLRLRVTATNASGTATATSPPTSVVLPAPAALLGAPSPAGRSRSGFAVSPE